jgi:glutamine amidotransferase
MIAIIDYRAGNLTSVQLGCDAIGVDARITSNADEIAAAERVIFPGVGAAGAAMQHITDLKLVDVIRDVVARGTPFLGICLGTQIIFERSEEDGGVDTIGLVSGQVRKFEPDSPWDKVPQMGWNSVRQVREHAVFEGIEDESEFYFVHSYYPAPSRQEDVIGETEYAGIIFASAVAKGNVVATQFHPEKSGRVGLKLLENFAAWDGKE